MGRRGGARETRDAKSSRPARPSVVVAVAAVLLAQLRSAPLRFARSVKAPCFNGNNEKKSRRIRARPENVHARGVWYIDVRDPKLSVSVSSERLVTLRDFFAELSLSLSLSLDVWQIER